MNLTDLQVELRQIGDRLDLLHREIEKMKPKSEDEQQAAFASINKLAAQAPLGSDTLFNAEPSVKKTFLQSLAYLIVSAGQDVNARLLYLCRLAQGVGAGIDTEMSAEALCKAGLEYKADDLRELAQLPQKLKYIFLVEALIAAHTAPESAPSLYAAIADAAESMQCDQEELRVSAAVAKGRLLGNYDGLDELPQPLRHKWNGKFADYIPYVWLSQRRVKCAELCLFEYSKKTDMRPLWREKFGGRRGPAFDKTAVCTVLNSLSAGESVQPGQIIMTYQTKEFDRKAANSRLFFGSLSSDQLDTMRQEQPDLFEEYYRSVQHTVTAPRAGTLFLANTTKKGEIANHPDEYLEIYVVSPFDSYKAFSSWAQQGH